MNEVFVETIRIECGKIHNSDLHERRMAETACYHFSTTPKLPADIVASIPQNLKHERVKCRVLYSDEVLSVEYHLYEPKPITSLQLVYDDTITYRYKSTNRSNLLKLLEQRGGADDIIIVKHGKITDSSYSNLVFEAHNGELFTPSTYLLYGTKRQALLSENVISEREITPDDLYLYNRVFFINAMLDLEDNISVQISEIRV